MWFFYLIDGILFVICFHFIYKRTDLDHVSLHLHVKFKLISYTYSKHRIWFHFTYNICTHVISSLQNCICIQSFIFNAIYFGSETPTIIIFLLIKWQLKETAFAALKPSIHDRVIIHEVHPFIVVVKRSNIFI